MKSNRIKKENYRIIREAIKNKSEILVWSLPNNLLIKTNAIFSSFDSDNREISIRPIGGKKEELIKLINGYGRMNIYLPDQSIVFASRVKKLLDDGTISLEDPEYAQFFERRIEQRIDLDSSVRAEFEVDGKSYRKGLLDISDGGFSIVFSKNEKIKWAQDTIVEEINLRFRGIEEKICLKARVAYVLKVVPFSLEKCPYGGLRVSFQFIDLKENEKQIISSFLKNK